ncbi:hypothetical protein SAMN05216203_0479 [Marinobacter daqiaonensis]|uniref:Uncharacterized protein n=1 Tax=Marinobacter daqiaonensis TaxID=650891 RepID=A0A1I6GUA8_9GAMM|nr:hypothetical protein [Marinobacter daqiaonensis]SFR45750.1 hypothetical protein SAMN05216203_0479 [Marinobacter daqiaonensis]
MTRAYSGILVFFLAGFLVAAQAWSSPLSEGQVKRFVAVMEALQTSDTYLHALDEAWDQGMKQKDTPVSVLVSDTVALLVGHDAHDVLERLVEEHGFADVDTWSSVGDRVMLAVMSLEMGDTAPTLEAEIPHISADLANNPNFSAEQKASMRNMLSHSAALLAKVTKVPEADRTAVRLYLGAVKRVLKYERG